MIGSQIRFLLVDRFAVVPSRVLHKHDKETVGRSSHQPHRGLSKPLCELPLSLAASYSACNPTPSPKAWH